MRILHLSQKILQYFFYDLCFHANAKKFRLLDLVILLHAIILGMTLKGLVSICSH